MANISRIKTRLRCTRVFVATLIFHLFSFCLRYTYSLSVLSTNKFETSAKQILERHNQFRKCHDAPPLKLNYELNKQAQNEAIALAMHKISTIDRRGNFYQLHTNHSLEEFASDREAGWFSSPVDSWYGEIKFYDGGYTPQTDHFIRLVWRNSKSLGVGVAKSDDGIIYVVCKYDPVGDVENSYDQNVYVDANMVNSFDVCRDFMRPRTSTPKSGPSKSTPEADTADESSTDSWTPAARHPSSTSRSESKASTESSNSSKSTQSLANRKSTFQSRGNESSLSSESRSSRTFEKSTTEGAGSKPSSQIWAGFNRTSTTQSSVIGLKPVSVSTGKSTTKEAKIGSSLSALPSVTRSTTKTYPSRLSSEYTSKSTVSKASTNSDATVSMAGVARPISEASPTTNRTRSDCSPFAFLTNRTSESSTASTTESRRNTSHTFPILNDAIPPPELEPSNNGSVVAAADESPRETKFLKFALLLLGLLLVSLAVVISLLTIYVLTKLFFCCLKVRCGSRSQETNIGGAGGAAGGIGGSTMTSSPPATAACVISMSSRPVSPTMSRPASPSMFQNSSLTRLY